MKKYLLLASAILAFASCANDNYLGTEDEKHIANGERPITFGFDVPVATRAEGATAATALGNQFIVYGEKSEDADGYKYDKVADDAHQLVYQNYVVKYTTNSAYTTTSNTKNWEYVGLTQTYGDNVTPKADETQTIKYWDYSASNYVFTAFSALESDLSSGNVTVTKIQEKTDGNKVFDKGYTVVLNASADPTKLYFSDRTVITTKNTTVNREANNEIGGNVKLTFRSGISQFRVGMFETIPGYEVKIKKFYYQNSDAPTFTGMSSPVTTNFTANVPNLTTANGATLTVTYYHEGTRLNQPKIAVTGTPAKYITMAGTGLAENVVLGTEASSATYNDGNNFTTVFPQETNNKTLKLKLDYQLHNTKTGETINVTGATAEVPAEYLQWKPNFKYTYLFKISDNTNGYTGPSGNPAGLYPITFDAVTVEAEDGSAEYITTVSEPSITTFGVKAGKYSVGKNEYETGTAIYATIMEGSSVVTPVEGDGDGKVNYYSIAYKDGATDAEKAAYPITEASVAEAIAEAAKVPAGGTPMIVCTKNNDLGAPVTSVPTEDGLTVAQNAVEFSSLAAGIYAIEYTATSAWTGSYKKVYKVIKVVAPAAP